jgi:hypothetical protein
MILQEGQLSRASFPPWCDVVGDELVFVQERKLACTSFPPRWDDVVRDELVLVQKRNLAHASFSP